MTSLHDHRMRLPALLIAWVLVWAAQLTAAPPPAAPPSGLYDDTRVIPAADRAEVENDLAATKSALGCDLWVATMTYVDMGQNLRAQARDLRLAWSGEKPAVILAYDRANDTQLINFSPALWQRYPAATLARLMQRSAMMRGPRDTAPRRFSAFLKDTLRQLREMEMQRRQAATAFSPADRPLGAAFAALLLGGGGLALALGTAARRRTAIAAWQSYFPEVQVGLRFGAPHGGGVVVVHDRNRIPAEG